MKTNIFVTTLLYCATIVSASQAEEIGSVDTEFKVFGPDHKIVIEAFDDPKIKGSGKGVRSHLLVQKLFPRACNIHFSEATGVLHTPPPRSLIRKPPLRSGYAI